MGDIPYIWFRGKRMTPAVRDALLAAEQRAGFNFVVTQGGFNAGGVAASAGTHDGDALDLRTRDLDKAKVARMVEAMRWAGFAAWYRTRAAQYGVRAQGFSTPHVHAVPNGWGLPSAGARSQAAAYRAGRDGLARNLADIGPGHVSTWRTKTRPEKPDPRTPLERYLDDMDEKKLRAIIREEAQTAVAREKWAPIGDKKYGAYWGSSMGNMVGHASAHAQALRREVAAMRVEIADLRKQIKA